MKAGDLVKWIGFPGAGHYVNGLLREPSDVVGVIIKIHNSEEVDSWVDIAWANGTFGDMLYPQTVKVINESR